MRAGLAGLIILIVLCRVMPQRTDPPFPWSDRALSNMLSFGLSAIIGIWLWAWFCFTSEYSVLMRRLVMIGGILIVVGLVASFRLKEFDGFMIARFAPRWQPAADRLLGAVPTANQSADVDLTTATPADFPEFLGPGRRCWIEDPGLTTDWSAQPPKLIWKRPIGAGWSAFSAVNGYAVTMEQRGDDEWVTCYEIATGEPVWGNSIEARHENVLGGIGPRSTPTIHNGRVYSLGATGVLQCLEGRSGKVIWKHDLLKMYGLTQSAAEVDVMWGRAASPLIVDGLVVVPAGGKQGSGKASTPKSLVAFRAKDGRKAWEAGSSQISYASPVIATLGGMRQIVMVNEKTVSGHEPETGRQLWEHPWPGDSSTNASSSQPVPLPGDLLLLSKGYGGGAELLQFASPANSADGDDEETDPTTKWANSRVLQTKFTNVTVIGGNIYGLSDGILECVDPNTGQRRWKRGRYGHGQILGVGELILIQAEDGRVALVRADPDQHVELGQFQALEGKTWNNLCLYGKMLLVRNGEQAACYALP